MASCPAAAILSPRRGGHLEGFLHSKGSVGLIPAAAAAVCRDLGPPPPPAGFYRCHVLLCVFLAVNGSGLKPGHHHRFSSPLAHPPVLRPHADAVSADAGGLCRVPAVRLQGSLGAVLQRASAPASVAPAVDLVLRR